MVTAFPILKTRKYCRFLVLVLFFLASSSSLFADNLTHGELAIINKEIVARDRPVEPYMHEGILIFTFEPDYDVMYAGISFKHEKFKTVYPYRVNNRGIYYAAYKPPRGRQKIEYRLMVDGLWQTDPSNPRAEVDPFGVKVSIVELSAGNSNVDSLTSPVIEEKTNMVTFTCSAPPDSNVSVTGNFNNFDPFMHIMQPEGSGVYQITVPVLPGRYYYYFIVNGKKVLDPFNKNKVYINDSVKVSTFTMPR